MAFKIRDLGNNQRKFLNGTSYIRRLRYTWYYKEHATRSRRMLERFGYKMFKF